MPGGRPTKIDQIVGTRTIEHKDGSTEEVNVTAADRILSALRTGNYFEQACAAAGVHKETAYGWLRRGAQAVARAAMLNLPVEELDLPPTDLRYVEFSDAVAQAEAQWEVQANTLLENAARGGVTEVTVTEKHDANGNLVETTTRTTTLPPNVQVIEWRLTRRYSERYYPRVGFVFPAVADELSVEDKAEVLAGELRAFLAGRADVERERG